MPASGNEATPLASAEAPLSMSASASPFVLLRHMTTGWVMTRGLQVVADLGVADALDDASTPAASLAAETGAHPRALERVLRLLAARGVFAIDDAGLTSHTPASRLLRDDHTQSLKAFVRMMGLPSIRAASEQFGHSARTGRPAAEIGAPDGIFPYFGEHPDEARVFGEAMTAKAHAQVAGPTRRPP